MAERKHLNQALRYFLLYFIFSGAITYASAWLPEVGSYNFYLSHSSIDALSKKRRNMRQELFIDMQNEIEELSLEKSMIYQRATALGRGVLSSELEDIKEIESDIAILEQDSSELSSFSDDSSSYFELEYGLADFHSFGTKLGYKEDKFADIDSGKVSKTKSGQEIDIFYKYKIFNDENWIVTLRPKVHFGTYDKRKSLNHTDLEILIGRSNTKKYYDTYFEIGIRARKYYSRVVGDDIGYVLTLQEGIKLWSGFSVTNYTEYEKAKFANILYKRTIYDQISVAKEIKFSNLKLNYFTAQIGYFWKGSLVNRAYTVSGPVFSLWFNV